MLINISIINYNKLGYMFKLYKCGLTTSRIREQYIHNSIHTLPVDLCTKHATLIRECDSTLYVGMARKKDGHPYISIGWDELK